MKAGKWIWLAVISLSLLDILFLLFYPKRKNESADLIIHTGRIVTMDPVRPEVEALAAAGGRIIELGGKNKVMRRAGPKTRIIDLKGALAVPGLIETHGHLLSLGAARMTLDLAGAENWDRIVAMVAEAVEKTGRDEWIEGRGWQQEHWNERPQPEAEGFPLHHALSAVSPDNPVVLAHADGRSCLVNARAMNIVGITRESRNPAGGRIVKDSSGNPTGALVGTARELVSRSRRHRTVYARSKEIEKQALAAAGECLAHGITTFHDAGNSYDVIDVYKNLARGGDLPIRLYVMINEPNDKLLLRGRAYRLINLWDYHLTVRAIRRLIGARLEAYDASLVESVENLSGSTRFNTEPIEDLKETAAFALENGFQLSVYVKGGQAGREVLDTYEETFKSQPGKFDFRWHIVHTRPADAANLPRFERLGVTDALENMNRTPDGLRPPKKPGGAPAEPGTLVWEKANNARVITAEGTELPAERIDPIACFHALVTRNMKDKRDFYQAQKMTREEALRSYTIFRAYLGFEDGIKGSFVRGKLADITVLSRDILTCPAEDILSTEVLCTIVGGKVLYEKYQEADQPETGRLKYRPI